MNSKLLAWVTTLSLTACTLAASATPAWAAWPQDSLVLLESTHHRMLFDQDVMRVAVGNPETLSAEVLNSGEILVLGKRLGNASLVVWLADGSVETRSFSVRQDLSLLKAALADIHSSIRAEYAPDRDTVVLRGLVPDITYRLAAVGVAEDYLDSGNSRDQTTTLVSDGPSAPAPTTVVINTEETVRVSDDQPSGTVINLIRVETLPPLADKKLRQALEPIPGAHVSVRRVLYGDLPNDDLDLFVLEGDVQDQVTLTRVLFLASRALLGEASSGQNDIQVLADEGGALTNARQIFGASGGGGGGGGGQSNLSLGGGSGGGNRQGGQQLVNRIGANLGRAKVVEAAGGRILSLINVEHLPLVRVDVRMYEVNLSRLREWRNELGVITSDFDQGALSPSPAAVALQGSSAAAIGQDDVQNVFNFLDGGISNQLQLVSGGLAVDDVFQLLVTQEIARSVSRPSLTVLSGELALFQVGGQIPVSVAQTVGGGTDQVLNSVVFRDFGVQLSVRPLVEEHNSETITLDLTPTISMPDLGLTAAIGSATGAEVGSTAFETRGARTHTRLRDGDAMLLGGLNSQRDSRASGKTPWLGDLPLAGWLFRNESGNEEEFELVIMVNPVIVRPERPDARLWGFIEPGEVLQACLEEVEIHSEEHQTAAEKSSTEKEAESGTPSSRAALSQ